MNEILYHTNYLDLKSTLTKNGASWVYAHRPNTNNIVVILAKTKDEVLFLIEERPPIQAEQIGIYTIGLVAGLVGDERTGESIEEALHSELLEEAGLIANKIEIKVRKVASSAGCISETCLIAIAHIENKTPIQAPIDDGGVIIDRVWVKINEIQNWLRKKEEQGFVITAQALAALFYLYE